MRDRSFVRTVLDVMASSPWHISLVRIRAQIDDLQFPASAALVDSFLGGTRRRKI
jgi:hypothetical protein